MITAISSSNPSKVSFAANPVRGAERGIEVGEKLAGKAADSFERIPKGLTPGKLPVRLSNDVVNDETVGQLSLTSTVGGLVSSSIGL